MAVNYNKPIDIRDNRNGGWFWIDKEVWSDERLTQSDKVVYGTLAYFANNKNQTSFPSITTFEKYCCISGRQIYRSIKKLEGYKYILVIRQGGKSNRYTLIDDAILERKTTPDNLSLVTNNTTTPDIEHGVPLTNNTTNNTYSKQKLINNNGVNNSYKKEIDKITLWAYTRAFVKPSIPQEKFRESVEKAISRVGYSTVHDTYAEQDNAIAFLTDLKSL